MVREQSRERACAGEALNPMKPETNEDIAKRCIFFNFDEQDDDFYQTWTPEESIKLFKNELDKKDETIEELRKTSQERDVEIARARKAEAELSRLHLILEGYKLLAGLSDPDPFKIQKIIADELSSLTSKLSVAVETLKSIIEYWNGAPESAVDAIETVIERAEKTLASLEGGEKGKR